MLDTAELVLVFWVFAIGAAVGSFLNVVVYRLPLGMSIVHPPSHCPRCGNRIAWYDNVPLLGWIVLRGRCRRCGHGISARYPLVEAIAATMFAIVAIAELSSRQWFELCLLYPYHIVLLCTLLAAALIEYDGNRPPWRLFAVALTVGIAAPLLWPNVAPLPAWEGAPPLIDQLLGLASGGLLAGLAWLILRGDGPRGLAMGLLCVGLFLGWQAVIVIAMLTALLMAMMWLRDREAPFHLSPGSLWLFMVTLSWLLTAGWMAVWRPLV